MAQAKPVYIQINGYDFLCKDLKSAQKLLTALDESELIPLRMVKKGDEYIYTKAYHTYETSLSIGKKEVDFDWKDPEDEIDAMDEYPPADHDSHNAE